VRVRERKTTPSSGDLCVSAVSPNLKRLIFHSIADHGAGEKMQNGARYTRVPTLPLRSLCGGFGRPAPESVVFPKEGREARWVQESKLLCNNPARFPTKM